MNAVLAAQAALTASAGLAAWMLSGGSAAASAGVGGGIAMASVLVLARRLGTLPRRTSPAGIAAERLALHLGAFLLAIGTLRLSPIPLLATFAIAQFGYLAAFRATIPTLDGGSSWLPKRPIPL